MARDRMMRARDRAAESSWLGPLLGAGIGALVAKTLQSRARERRWEGGPDWDRGYRGPGYRGGEWYGRGEGYPRYPYPRETEEQGWSGQAEEPFAAGQAREDGQGKLAEAGSQLADRASEVKDRAKAKAEEVRGRVQEKASELRERLPDRERLRASAREDTALWALGAMALGALFGFALPVSERERELLEPVRRKARDLGEEMKEKVAQKGSEAMGQATSRLEGAAEAAGPHGSAAPAQGGAPTPPGPSTPIH